MSKHLIKAAVFCLLAVVIGSSFINDEIVFWNKNHPLTFDDFKGRPAVTDTSLAIPNNSSSTHKLGTILKSIDVKLVTKGGKTTFTIYAGMNRNQSWIRNKNDSITLKHEQGHFDICELYARMLRQEIQHAKTLAEANSIFNKISDEENAEQDAYDKENTFKLGGITPKWQASISEKLAATDKYQNPVVTLPIYK